MSAVHPTLAEALSARGYAELTPVQQAAVEPANAGRDLLVSARTGSGKTVAFGLALAPDLLGEAAGFERAGAPLALVIAPTRELAQQVQRELEWLYAGAGTRVVPCVGGMDPRREARELAAGAHIVVGTPGRLRDHLERGQLRTDALRAVVLDEADEMLDLGFREELEEILDTAPAERRTLLFSATLPPPIVAMATRYQRDALRLEVGGGERGHADIAHQAVPVAPSDVENAVVNLLRFHEAKAALVFCSTREAVRRLHASLVERGFDVVALSGELTQSERGHALQALRDRRARVCVATDVAARGIDVADLELVIHADLPHDAETLQHRAGRTGRAGRKGTSVLLVPHPRRRRAEQLLRAAGAPFEWSRAPAAEAIRERDRERLVAAVDAGDPAEEDRALAAAMLEAHGAETLALAYVRLNRQRLPSPEDLLEAPEPGFGRRPAPTDRRSASFGERPVPEEGERPARTPRPGFEDSAWFRIDLGRNRNAEARWLLPLICRRGHITKAEIGAIRVQERETRFEVVGAVAERFKAALKATAGEDDGGVRIVALDDAGPLPPRVRKPKAGYGTRETAEAAPAAERPVKPGKPKKPWAPKADAGEARPLRPKTFSPKSRPAGKPGGGYGKRPG